MYVKPKLHQHYWYVGQDDNDFWTILEKDNENEDMDKYNMACQNCFSDRETAESQLFEQITQQMREDGYQIWLEQEQRRKQGV